MSSWKVIPGVHTYESALQFVAAENKVKSNVKWRLPSKDELLTALHNTTAFDFGIATATWTNDATVVVDPKAEEIVNAATADSTATVALYCYQKDRPAAPVKRKLKILGYLDTASYQQCVEAAQYLNSEYKNEYDITVEKMLGYQFERRRMEISETNEAVSQAQVLVVEEGKGTVTTGDAFIGHVCSTTGFKLFDVPDSDPGSYITLARAGNRMFLKSTGSTFCWMLIKIDGQVQGRIVFQLFSNLCPKTCQNFVHLCRGDVPDATDDDGKPVKLHYKGSSMYRVVKDGWIQGGDIHGAKKGNSGWSIYGKTFPDESFVVPHDDIGILGMANDGEHTNRSSFYVTTGQCKWMNKRYVAFGRVVEGLTVVQAIHGLPTKHNQEPMKKVTIDDCGYISLDS